MKTVKFIYAIFALLSLGSMQQPAQAQDWPKRPVRIVVPYPPGAGAADLLARKLGEKLAQKWKQPVIIDNKTGAVEIIAATDVAHAKPDGYTLLMSTEAALETNQFLYSKLPYDPEKDFTPITRLTEGPYIYVVRSDSPYQTMQQMVAAAKAKPGKISYGSNGIGGNVHIAVNWLSIKAGKVELLHVPYRGAVPTMQGLIGGEIDFAALPLPAVAGFLSEKRVRAIATSGSMRLRSMPDVPTTGELGYDDTVVQVMFALSGPAKLPADITNMIARDVTAVLKDSDFVAQNVEPFGFVAIGDSPEEFARFLAKDREKQRERVKAANVKMD
jgi:tripartite-type tricarboxylate transporter receptor subunit TctC